MAQLHGDFAQGALEYLIIIAAVIAIAAVVITTISGMLYEQKIKSKISSMKKASSECSQAISTQGKELGEPYYDICSNLCSDWKDQEGCKNTYTQLTEKGLENVENPYEACLAGKPSWIRRRTEPTGYLLCDGFNADKLNSKKWCYVGDVGGKKEVKNGILYLYHENKSSSRIKSSDSFESGTLTFRAKFSNQKWVWGGFKEGKYRHIIFDRFPPGEGYCLLHNPGENLTSSKKCLDKGSMDKKWHTYKIIKKLNETEFYVDGDITFTRDKGVEIAWPVDFVYQDNKLGANPTEIEWVKVAPVE